MKHYIKIAAILFLRILLRVFYVFPVKRNRVLFSSFEGKNYGCNPKYIFEYFYGQYGGEYEYVWNIDDVGKIPDKYNVKTCRQLTLKHLYYFFTSHVIISNQPIIPFFPKRKKVLFINTTHGSGAYKKGGINAAFVTKADRRCMVYMRNLRAKMIDYVISGCSAYTEIFTQETEYNINKDRFLSIGMPRNDLFFEQGQDEKKKKIRMGLGIDAKVRVVLYAPTYRGSYRHTSAFQTDLDTSVICRAVKQRFGGTAVFLYRSHIIDKKQHLDFVMDVSGYQDMQELLLITDVFITDYSSSIWDFSLTGKPGFLFMPDLADYQAEVSFHTSIDTWPFPYSSSTEELCEAIIKYDEEKAHEKIHKHHDLLGSYENGHATSEVCKILTKHMEKYK
ncbi:CDP-glycerol glycerophosphotransferase family protein [Parabacteroides sp.]|uniref:CDP-glycerol glycerophosphotransferase family protein n=1 Tax=Parabacteroides sp. TaxID=1869337 RepID=UPI00257A9DC1|nr:CDP-glycerol glycerophosphotransferase family protein [Parabacteroides sp.]